MIRKVIFDLDGTLANTADLAPGYRKPADVLELSPPGLKPVSFSFGEEVCRLPGRLIARGYDVGIMTRAPIAYASTLLELLEIDYQDILASAGKSVDYRAASLREISGALEPSEVLFVGDTEDDKKVALRVGTRFERPPWLDGGVRHLLGVKTEAPRRSLNLRNPRVKEKPESGLLDIASGRVKKGIASAADAELLFRSGMWAVLFEYKATRLLEDPRARARLSGDEPPWRFMTKSLTGWTDFIHSGDIARLLDVSSTSSAQHLPNEILNAAVQRVADLGGFVTLDEDWKSLDPNVRALIARPLAKVHPSDKLRSAIIDRQHVDKETLEYLESKEFTAEGASILAGAALRSFPQQTHRRSLQSLTLRGFTESARDCILKEVRDRKKAHSHNLASVTLLQRIITRAELCDDAGLRDELTAAMTRLFPPINSKTFDGIQAYACVDYRSDWGEKLLVRGKDWRGLKSGQDTHLGLLWIPAIAIGATVKEFFGRDAVVVPVPATQFSREQPGQFSERLGYLAARYTGLNIQHVLKKSDDNFEVTTKPVGDKFVIIDDQLTNGGSVKKAIEALRNAGVTTDGVVTWSASRLNTSRDSVNEHCWWQRSSPNLGVKFSCPHHGLNRDEFPGD